MTAAIAFYRFWFAPKGKAQLKAWHELRRLCFARMGMDTKRKK